VTNFDIALAQFRKNRGAVWCVRGVLLLLLLATYAPLLALDVPFWTDLGGGSSFPWFSSLFDPRVFGERVDLFFNLLMGTLPLLPLLWRRPRRIARWQRIAAWAALHAALFLGVDSVRQKWRTQPLDYAQQVHAAGASALFPPVAHHPGKRDSRYSLTGPLSRGHTRAGSGAEGSGSPRPYFILGSDNLGNDVLTRLLYGTRISLTIGVLSVAIYLLIGVVLGAVAGYFGGWIDDGIMLLTQAMMTIPFFFLLLFLIAVRPKTGIYDIMLVIGIVSWPTVLRLVRGEFLKQREIDYVVAARSLGLSNARIMFRHIVPNSLAPVFVSATFGVAVAILAESSLSFLGLGDPEAPSWGQILKIGYETRPIGTHLIWSGGLAIFGLVLMINVIGEALRDALDPKLRK